MSALLVVFGGLPGTGKTTLSRLLADRRAATYLRIDVIDAVLSTFGYDVTESPVARDGWSELARSTGARLAQIEVICSEPAEHRRRVEAREPDLHGYPVPDWQQVADREYQPWQGERLVVDNIGDPQLHLAAIERYLDQRLAEL